MPRPAASAPPARRPGRPAPASRGPDRTRALGRATALTLGGTLVVTATNLAGTLVLARALGPEGKGAVSAVLLVAALASYAGSPGLAQASIYATARLGLPPAAVRGNALAAAAVLGLSTGLAAMALAPRLLAGAGPEALGVGRLVFLCTPLALAQDYSLALLQGLGRYDLFTIGRTVGRALYPAGLAGLGLAGALSVTTALAAWVVTAPAGLLLVWWLVDRAGAGRPQLRPDLLPRYAGYGLRLHLGTLAELIELRLDQVLLALLVPPAALGQYALAVTASELLACLPNALAVVLLGGPAAGPAAGPDAARAAAQRAISRALAAQAGAGLPAALAAPWLVSRLLPPGFAPAATAFQLLVPGALALGLGRMLAGALAGQGHPLAAAPARLVSLALTLVLAPLLIPRLGIAGAAVASTAAYSGAALCLLGASRRALGWRWQALVLPGSRA
ncbi:MAG: polysaccharide biosynthesis C-terminal domain-containing protein [Firmicutes bacterium]|nr:polysaccharide biosynthesis C-terminal domain-containing protein [Bacillota bacterium]